jgi:hypothetical protein
MKSAQLPYRVADSIIKQALRVVPPSPISEQIALWWGYRYRDAFRRR